MAKNNLKSLALKFTREEETEEEKIEKIYCFVKEEIKYKITVIGDSKKILEGGYGSCLDKALLFSELLKSIGIKSRYHVIVVNLNLLFKKFLLTKFISFHSKPLFYSHVFNEVYTMGKWKKLDTSLDSEVEKYLQKKKVVSKKKECCFSPEYILKDLGNFNKLSDIFTASFSLQLIDRVSSYKKEIQFGLNFFNRFLYQKRKNKAKGLKEKETIEDILVNINKLKE